MEGKQLGLLVQLFFMLGILGLWFYLNISRWQKHRFCTLCGRVGKNEEVFTSPHTYYMCCKECKKEKL